jgi:23S rRNA pseudouridine1911/1915/1917 synthase
MKLTVAADEQGRIDKVLAKHYPGAGRRQLAELFEAGEVKLRGKKAKKGDTVAPGDEIELAREPVSGDALRPQPDPALVLEVLLETAEIIVVNKPSGVPSQPLRAGELGTIANAIVARWPECAAIGDDPRDGGLAHRLDIGTSGGLVAARTAESYRRLREAFGKGDVQKQYLAIVEGVPSVNEVEAPLSQRGDHVAVDHNDGLTAFTTLQPLESSGSYSLVRCIAKTGRMHQVRAHLAFAGSPIAGDTLYKGAPLADHPGFFLHAHTMSLPALGGDAVEIIAPIPKRFRDAAMAVGLASLP